MKRNRGFTLIELLVVMSIIALLLTIGLSFYGNAQRATRDAKRRGDLDAIRKALEIYRTERGNYAIATTFPCAITGGYHWAFSSPNGGVQGSLTGCPASLKNGLASYFVNSSIPEDPYCSTTDDTCQNSWNNYYIDTVDGTTFTLYAQLENAPTTPCASPPFNYCVRSQN